MTISKSSIIRARELCKQYKVRLLLRNIEDKDFAGEALLDAEQIHIYLKCINSDNDFLSVICHELGHIICARKKKYKVFHSSKMNKKNLNRNIQILRKTALSAELYVDDMGERIFKKNFKDLKLKYLKSYRNKKERACLSKYVEEIIVGMIEESKRRRLCR